MPQDFGNRGLGWINAIVISAASHSTIVLRGYLRIFVFTISKDVAVILLVGEVQRTIPTYLLSIKVNPSRQCFSKVLICNNRSPTIHLLSIVRGLSVERRLALDLTRFIGLTWRRTKTIYEEDNFKYRRVDVLKQQREELSRKCGVVKHNPQFVGTSFSYRLNKAV